MATQPEDKRTAGEKVEDVYTRMFEQYWRRQHGDDQLPDEMAFAVRNRARNMRLEIDGRRTSQSTP